MTYVSDYKIATRFSVLLSVLFSVVVLFWLASFQIVGAVPTGVTYYVNQNVVGGASTGITWTHAFTSLQSALDVAVSGDEIWVAKGVYIPTTQYMTDDVRTKTFSLTSGVQLYGGFAGGESLLEERDFVANKTVLSGDYDGDDTTDSDGILHNAGDIVGDNAYHVVFAWQIADATTRLDGFVVTGGNADGLFSSGDTYLGVSLDCSRECGGGIRNYGSDVSYANLVVRGNQAELGGGIYNNSSSSQYVNVQVIGNAAEGTGGGFKNTHSPITLINVVVVGNRAYPHLGSNGNGAGISSFGSSSDVEIYNSVIAFNSAFKWAGGIQNEANSSVYITNTIVWGNETDSGDHSIFYGPADDIIVGYSLISGTAAYTGTGNITSTISPFIQDASPGGDGDWLTSDDDFGDLTLVSGAAPIDAGNTSAVPIDFIDLDEDGDTSEMIPVDAQHGKRVLGSAVDMGAYEFVAVVTPTLSLTATAATTMTLGWDDSTGCSFDAYVSNHPYMSYTAGASDVSSPLDLAYSGSPTFYYVEAACGVATADSNKMGGFTFDLEPGS